MLVRRAQRERVRERDKEFEGARCCEHERNRRKPSFACVQIKYFDYGAAFLRAQHGGRLLSGKPIIFLVQTVHEISRMLAEPLMYSRPSGFWWQKCTPLSQWTITISSEGRSSFSFLIIVPNCKSASPFQCTRRKSSRLVISGLEIPNSPPDIYIQQPFVLLKLLR